MKRKPNIWAWLWRVTDHEVVGGLVLALILVLIGVHYVGHDNQNSNQNDQSRSADRPAVVPSPSGPPSVAATSPPASASASASASAAGAPRCPKGPTSPAGRTIRATGSPPWTVEGYGVRYTVVAVTRTASSWAAETKPSIMITGCVTRTRSADYHKMFYRFSDAASSSALETVPFQGGGDGDPPLGQTSRLVSVVWDVTPGATRLTINLHDFYWPDSRNLIMRNVPVSA